MKKIKDFLNSIFIKNSGNKKWSVIVDTKMRTIGVDYYGNTAIRIENVVEFNNDTYLFVARCVETGIIIDTRNADGSLRFKNTQLTAYFLNDESGWYIKLLSINKLDKTLQCKNGFGYLLMKFMFDIASAYEKINSIYFTKLIGIIGTEAQDKPEESIPLYKKFNNYLYDENTSRYLILDMEHCNIIDKELYYSIEQKK